MTPQQLEEYRRAILEVLEKDGSDKFGLSLFAIDSKMRRFCYEPDSKLAGRELQYLIDKGFVAPVRNEISPANGFWRITAAGRDYLATSI